MTKKEWLNLALGIVVEVIPGAKLTKSGIEAIVKMNDDPDDDVQEITGAATKIAMGVVLAAHGFKEKPVVNVEVLAVLNAKLESDIAWYVAQVKRLKVQQADATGVPV